MFDAADCAVCEEHYAPGLGRRCQECSEHSTESTWALSALAVLLVGSVTVMFILYLVQNVDDEARREQSQARRWWKEKLTRVREFIAKVVPLSAIRIVVVVAQIVVQVGDIEGRIASISCDMSQSVLIYSFRGKAIH